MSLSLNFRSLLRISGCSTSRHWLRSTQLLVYPKTPSSISAAVPHTLASTYPFSISKFVYMAAGRGSPAKRQRTESDAEDSDRRDDRSGSQNKSQDSDGDERPQKHDSDARTHAVESENKTDDWKHRAPYKIHGEGEFDAKYHAECNCGKVKFQLSREKPLDAKYCHCTTCQTLHGAPFQWAAIFHKTDINFTHGHHDLVWFDPGSKTTRHQLPCKLSCAHCRTPLMDEGRNMILMYPTLIKWSEGKKGDQQRKKFEVSCHMFYGRRVLDIKDGKPKWSGLNDSSELMEE